MAGGDSKCCPNCGEPMVGGASGDSCTDCLLRMGLGDGSAADANVLVEGYEVLGKLGEGGWVKSISRYRRF